MNDIEKLTKDGIRKIPPYIPGRTSESIQEKYHLTRILKLASNENQYGTSPKALEAMKDSLTSSNIYPDPFCIGLRKKLGIKYGFDSSGDNVIISSGACGILSLLGEVFICESDEVIFCTPTFGIYESTCERNGGIPIALPLTADQRFDLDAIQRAVTPKTKMIFICNPNNPSGTAVDSAELKRLINTLPKNIIIVVDEAYIEFADDPAVESMIPETADNGNLIVIRTFSKIYGLAGQRLGYSFMNKELHAVLQKSTPVFVATRTALAGAMAALDDDEFVEKTRKGNSEGRAYLTKELRSMGWTVYPSYTNFLYADSGYNAASLADELEKKGLIIRGNFPCSRITIGTMEQNREVIEIIRQTLKEGRVSEKGK
ncbi:MAG: histidinol-phosphate transaminase [Treponema sp.]|nr:histidinol-phosphate transaminase [Treponema sp.]